MDRSCDFPAAHSMDTAWFAVDLDGHVAFFETGEAGALPIDAGEEELDVASKVTESRAAHTDVVHDRDGYAATAWQPHARPRTQGSTLVFVRSLDDARPLLDAGAKPAKARAGAAVIVAASAPALEAFHRGGDACLGCYPLFEDDAGPLAARGVYEFHHTCENGIAGPYAPVRLPGAPASIDELPPAVLERAVRFDGRFAEVKSLQPAEHWECVAWGPEWLATDGKTVRPFEGREAEYLEAKAASRPDDGYVYVDVPAKPEPAAPPAAAPPSPSEPAPKKPWWKLW